MINKVTVKEVDNNNEKIYIGVTETNEKNRWYNNIPTFNNRRYFNYHVIQSCLDITGKDSTIK